MSITPFRAESFARRAALPPVFGQDDLDMAFEQGREHGQRQAMQSIEAQLLEQITTHSDRLEQIEDHIRDERLKLMQTIAPALGAIIDQCIVSGSVARLSEAVAQQFSITARQVDPGRLSIRCSQGVAATLKARMGADLPHIEIHEGDALSAELSLPGGTVGFDATHVIASLKQIIRKITEDAA